MPLWGSSDQPNNAPNVTVSANGQNARTQYGNTVFGVSAAEAGFTTGANAVTHAGWVSRSSYVDMHGVTRVKTETIVAMGSVSADIGVILRVNIADGGSGYANGEYLLLSGGGGSGAAITITTDANGVITSTTISSGGTGYTSAPTISSNTTGPIANVVINDGGSGYTNGETLSFTTTFGSGANVTITTDANGMITDTTINDGGTGYYITDTVGDDANTTGSGANLTISAITTGASANLVAVTTQDDSIYPDA